MLTFKGHRFLGACRHMGRTVKCTGEGGRVPSHRYSNEEKRNPLSCQGFRSNAVHNPSKAQNMHQYHNFSSLRNLPGLNHALRSRSCNCCFSLQPVKSHRCSVYFRHPSSPVDNMLVVVYSSTTAHIEPGGSAKTRSSSRPLTVTANIPRYYGSLV